MTSVTSTTGTTAAAPQKYGFAALGAGDFLKLMTAQLKAQDPLAPVDNKEMLAQMAQFSSLSTQTGMADTLSAISGKLDTILAAQNSATPTTTQTVQAAQAGA